MALIHYNCGEDSCDVDVDCLRCIRSCIGSIRGIGVKRVVRVSWMILLVEERAVVTPEKLFVLNNSGISWCLKIVGKVSF